MESEKLDRLCVVRTPEASDLFPFRPWACAQWPVPCPDCKVRACPAPNLLAPRPPPTRPNGGGSHTLREAIAA